MGGLIADLKSDFLKTVYMDLNDANMGSIRDEFAILRERAEQWLMQEQGHLNNAKLTYSAEMRYRGQSYELDTTLDMADVHSANTRAIALAFHAVHRRIYEHADEGAPVQIISLRIVIAGNTDKPEFPRHELRSGKAEPERSIKVWLDGQYRQIGLFPRSTIFAGQHLYGPAVVPQDDCTTIIPPGHLCQADEFGNLRVTQGEHTMTIDNIRLQVLANHCTAAAESMGYTIMRTAYSTFVKETEDLSAQLMTVDGRDVCIPDNVRRHVVHRARLWPGDKDV